MLPSDVKNLKNQTFSWVFSDMSDPDPDPKWYQNHLKTCIGSLVLLCTFVWIFFFNSGTPDPPARDKSDLYNRICGCATLLNVLVVLLRVRSDSGLSPYGREVTILAKEVK